MQKRGIHLVLLYLFLWVATFVYFLVRFSRRNESLSEFISFFFELASRKFILIGFHILFLLCCLLYLVLVHFVNVGRKKGSRTAWRQFSFRFLLPIVFLVVGFKTVVFINANEGHDFQWDHSSMNTSGKANHYYEIDKKHRGASVFGWSDDNTEAIANLIKANVEWVAVVPFLHQENEKTTQMEVPESMETYDRRDSSIVRAINDLHNKGLHVHLKPHLWMNEGWRANIQLKDEEAWDQWFESYRKNMLKYAKIAQETNTELFCVGTELKTSIKKQPEKWRSLISEIRTLYDGKLTYAANWHDEYEHIDFWDQLDYIGIQAYFPLTKEEHPTLESIEKGWDRYLAALEAVHKKYGKPVLFTEVGYKSTPDATIKPWEWGSYFNKYTMKKSDRTQQLAYEAMFKKNWGKPWFAGIYIWEWQNRTTAESAKTDLDFSPRFKPAENVIAKWFGTYPSHQKP